MDKKFQGKGYIGRIKSEDSFNAYDDLYAVVYKGKDIVNYNLFKSVCCTHNSKFFYSQKVNEKGSFTMEEALAAMNNYPMKGSDGLFFVTYPLTFAQFAFLAYDHGILTSVSGLKELGGRRDIVTDGSNKEDSVIDVAGSEAGSSNAVEKTITLTLPDALQTAKERAASIYSQSKEPDHNEVFDFENSVEIESDGEAKYDNEGDSHSEVETLDDLHNMSLDSLNERCLLAEAKATSLESLVAEKETVIANLKVQLEQAIANNQKFMSAADLANTKVREFRSGNASELVQGLQPEFALIKGVSARLSTLVKNVNEAKDEHSCLIIETLQILEDLPVTIKNALGEVSIKTNDTALTEAVKANSKIVSDNFKEIIGALKNVGITSEGPIVDLPLMIRDVHSSYPLHCNRATQYDPISTSNKTTQTVSSALLGKHERTPVVKPSKGEVNPIMPKKDTNSVSRNGSAGAQEVRKDLFLSSKHSRSSSHEDNRSSKRARFHDGQELRSKAGSSADNDRDVRPRSKASFPVWAQKPQNF